MGFVAKVARRIYPAHDELAIFAMALGVTSLALLDRQFGSLLVTDVRQFIVQMTVDAFESGWWEGVMRLFGLSVVFVITLIGLIVSLCLPFSRRRFDLLVVFVVMVHSIMITIANFVSAQEDDTGISAIIALLTFLWMTGYFACLRYDVIRQVVARRQASSKEGLVAGVLTVAVILVCSVLLHWHWAHSYAFAAVSAVAITQILVSEKEAGAEQFSEPSAEKMANDKRARRKGAWAEMFWKVN